MIGQKPHTIVVHHSAGLLNFESIRAMHKDERGYEEIAYNIVIDRDARLILGRPIGVQPAANSGKNAGTIAVCVIGDNTKDGFEWREDQKLALNNCITALRLLFQGEVEVLGHNTYSERIGKPNHTACPGISIDELYEVLNGDGTG